MIHLSVHAREVMAARDIDFAWVRETVAHPDFTRPDPREPTLTRAFKAIPDAGGRVLCVVHRPRDHDIVVVTVFFDRGAKP